MLEKVQERATRIPFESRGLSYEERLNVWGGHVRYEIEESEVISSSRWTKVEML